MPHTTRSVKSRIREVVESTPFIDTHEHLLEERRRVAGETVQGLFPCDDWAYLFMHYLGDDLAVAGMPAAPRGILFSPNASTDEKYRALEPYWRQVQHTGYGMAVRHTLKGLYGLDRLDGRTVHQLAERYRQLVRPGFYHEVLVNKANLEHCQVNSLERIFMRSDHPRLLRQDLSVVALASGVDLEAVRRDSGRSAATLSEWLGIVDWYFAEYGPLAVAVKSQSAYARRLDYVETPREKVEPVFERLARRLPVEPDDLRSLQNFLMRYVIRKATEYRLPIKLHTGYYAGQGYMPLERVRQNAGDVCRLLIDFPDARFVLMHIGYPYQDEYIAIAKHFANAWIDLCWAWIISPTASVRFVREFLTTAPSNKLFAFGGDYLSVETVYGHSRVARQGIVEALVGLVEDGWLDVAEASATARQIMCESARAFFPSVA